MTRILTVRREKSFVSSLMCDWVVLKYTKDELMKRTAGSHMGENGIMIAADGFNPNEFGTPIANGQELTFEIDSEVKTVFVVTMDGLLSNVIELDPLAEHSEIIIFTKGGLKVPGYPHILLKNKGDK